MKKSGKRFLEKGLFVTIGTYSIDLPAWMGGEIWEDGFDLIDDAKDIINIVVLLSSVVAVIMIIVSAYTLITASGNPDKIEQGQKTLTTAIVGLVIVWIAGLIVRFVLTLLGVT